MVAGPTLALAAHRLVLIDDYGCAIVQEAEVLDDEAVAQLLNIIAFPMRLQILAQLAVPRPLSEIEVHTERPAGGVEHRRTAAKQTVHEHVQKMADAGLITVEREGGRVQYAANPVLLYGVIQRLRHAIARSWSPAAGVERTVLATHPTQTPRAKGPRLVLVHGIGEGRSWPLDDDDGPWILGRGPGADIALDYDPYVSRETAEVMRQGDRHVVRDLASQNGMHVNWVAVPPATEVALTEGDVIGAGGSLLLFRR